MVVSLAENPCVDCVGCEVPKEGSCDDDCSVFWTQVNIATVFCGSSNLTEAIIKDALEHLAKCPGCRATLPNEIVQLKLNGKETRNLHLLDPTTLMNVQAALEEMDGE